MLAANALNDDVTRHAAESLRWGATMLAAADGDAAFGGAPLVLRATSIWRAGDVEPAN